MNTLFFYLKLYYRYFRIKTKVLYRKLAPVRKWIGMSLVIFGEYIERAIEHIEDKLTTKSNKLEAGFGKPHQLVRKSHQGFVIDGKRALTIKQSQNNALVIAPSGAGKSTVVIYPSILQCPHSMIINDNSGELSSTAQYLKSKGTQVQFLDFGAMEKSVYFNPLKRIANASDIAKVSSMLVRTSNEKADFWTLKSEELIAICIEYLIENESQIYRNLANVYHLLEYLQSDAELVEALFKAKASATLKRKLKGILKNSENTRASIISSALASISFIGNDKGLQDLTCTDTIDFKSFRTQNTALFIRCPLGDTTYYSKIISLFFEQFFGSVFNSPLPSEEDKHISIFADELGSLYLPNLDSIISNARKFKLPFLGVLQSENQLYENYGTYNAKTILNNAGVKVYFTGLTDESEQIEKTLGVYEYEDEKGITRTRSLMTADEIRTMSQEQILVIPGGQKPLKLKTTPFYKQRWMVNALRLAEEVPTTESESQAVGFTAQYLDLEVYRKELPKTKNEAKNLIKIPKYGS